MVNQSVNIVMRRGPRSGKSQFDEVVDMFCAIMQKILVQKSVISGVNYGRSETKNNQGKL